MTYTQKYTSPIGDILLAADEIGLSGLWFWDEKSSAETLLGAYREKEAPFIAQAKRWLDAYFGGKKPDFTPPLHLVGTDFRIKVWKRLLKIPYGKTVTYGDLAREMPRKEGCGQMSAQAIGGAVGHNKIAIIIPCHRVIGANGALTGYAGGLEKKMHLLRLEEILK